MQFLEERKQNKFSYTVHDVFGKIILLSKKRLKPEMLDDIFLAVFKTGDTTSSKESTGYIDEVDVHYRYIKANMWEDIVKEEPKKGKETIIVRIKHFINNLIKSI